MQQTLLCLGLGYSAEMLANLLATKGWHVIGTTRNTARAKALEVKGFEMHVLETLPTDVWPRVSHILHSIPPGDLGDEVLARFKTDIINAPKLTWLAYLSTTGVYGDHGGGWVNEETHCAPVSSRQKRRAQAELDYLNLYKKYGIPSHIFRLAGIYGPGRSVVNDIRDCAARRIYKEGQVFSRIHVKDIAQVLQSSIDNPMPGEIFNVCDNEPAPAHEVVTYACAKMGIEPPPLVAYEDAELSEMGREFYSSNRRVSNRKIREKLGVMLAHPTYREGVDALISSSASANSAD